MTTLQSWVKFFLSSHLLVMPLSPTLITTATKMSGTHVTSAQVAPAPAISPGRRYLNGALSGVIEVKKHGTTTASLDGTLLCCDLQFFFVFRLLLGLH
jgi:hypothetical protein